MSKYTKQFQLAVVKRYLKDSISYQSLAEHYGVDPSLVRLWVKRYELRGAEGLTKKFSHYSAEFKLSVLKHMWMKQLPYQEVALKYDIRNKGVVSQWERSY